MYEITRKLMKIREAREEEFKVVTSLLFRLLIVVSWGKRNKLGMRQGVKEKSAFKEPEGSVSTKKCVGEVVIKEGGVDF